MAVGKSGGSAVISWSDGGSPGTFRLYRGVRDTVAPWSYNQVCLGSPITGTSTTDSDIPADASTYFYLVTRKTSCGESVAGRNSAGAPVPNNSPCP